MVTGHHATLFAAVGLPLPQSLSPFVHLASTSFSFSIHYVQPRSDAIICYDQERVLPREVGVRDLGPIIGSSGRSPKLAQRF